MGAEKKNLTGLVKLISILSITLGLTIMIIAVSVVTGFQNEIRNKVIGFGSHIQISNFDYNVSYETRPFRIEKELTEDISSLDGVVNVHAFATKPGIIKTEDEIHGIIFKGVGGDYSWDFFEDKIVAGKVEPFVDSIRSDMVIISQYMAKLLMLKPDEDIFVYFIQDPPRVRRLTISAIYETGLEELDKIFVLGDIQHIQRLNNWDHNQAGGLGVVLKNYKDIDQLNHQIREVIPYTLNTRTINQIYPQIFDWLALLDMNVYVIIIIMILVAGINMITTLLIAVLEKTNLIGILKALGANNQLVRKVFLYHAGFLIGKGILFGNVLGIGLIMLQEYFGIIKLDQESYFVNVVPAEINLLYILFLNVGTFAICMLMLIAPSYIISKISPVKAITFR